MSKILIGSTYFFHQYHDFQSHDIDEIEIIDTDQFKYMRHISGQGRCLFQLKRKATVDDYIQDALNTNLGMAIGKFLIPDFCTEIGLTIKDLPKLLPLVAKLDEKHLYEKIIFDSYIKNGVFELTEDQKLAAYKNYRESRGI